jgi:hypothetical protein
MVALGGLPFNFYETVQIQGNAEQTEEKMKARTNYGKLMKGDEQVVWNQALYADAYLLDEISLLPKTKQDILLESLRTGRWNYLNGSVYFGKRPFFATSNYEENGKHNIDFRVRDRFAIGMELGWIPLYDDEIAAAEKRISAELTDEAVTETIISELSQTNGGSKSDVDKRKFVVEMAGKFSKAHLEPLGLHRVDDQAKREFRELVERTPFDRDSRVYLDFLQCELNATQLYGMKRRCTPPEDSTHSKAIASSKMYGAGRTPRAAKALRDYSRALAVVLGDTQVTRDHVDAIAPYVFAHRFDFTPDFQSTFEGQACERRADGVGESPEFEGVRRLLHDADKNWKTAFPQIELLDQYANEKIKGRKTLSEKQRADAEFIIDTVKQDPYKIDHPFVRLYAKKLIDEHGV